MKNFFGSLKPQTSGKKITDALIKQELENITPNDSFYDSTNNDEEKETRKRKAEGEEIRNLHTTKRLKKLKELTPEQLNEGKITVNIPKEKTSISYDEQAANYVADKLEKFKFSDKSDNDPKTNKFKFVSDEDNKKIRTLDDWKSKTENKSEKKVVTEVKKEVKEEKKIEIDTKSYFAMFANKNKSKEKPPVIEKTPKHDMEIEGVPNQENNTQNTASPATTQETFVSPDKYQNQKESAKTSPEEKPKQFTSTPQEKKQTANESSNKISSNEKNSTSSLKGLSFVIVGVLNSTTNEELAALLKELGADVTEEIDIDTTGLIMGTNLEDGKDVKESESYNIAVEIGTEIYNELEFDNYLFSKTGKRITDEVTPIKEPAKPIKNSITKTTTSTISNMDINTNKAVNTSYNNSQTAAIEQALKNESLFSRSKPPVKSMSMETEVIKNKSITSTPFASKQNTFMSQPQQSTPRKPINNTPMEKLWTDKYAPSNIGEVIGNQDLVRNLMEWLKDWESVVIHGNKKQAKYDASKGKDSYANINAKAALVSGPPGIGKTTSVRLIAKTMGYEVIEQNASDVRNKNAVEALLNHLVNNTLVSFSGRKDINKKFLILMDEVDGMSSGDRGGNQVLINAIKKTKAPIICICNDRQDQKVRSLANHCYDIKFQKPQRPNVVKRLREIAQREGLIVDNSSLDYLCESFGNDIRQMVNYLQLHSKRSKSLNYEDTKGSFFKANKDRSVMINNFDAAKMILGGCPGLTLQEKIDLFFVDYDLIPLLIHENYLPYVDRVSASDLERVAIAANCIAEGDVFSRRIRIDGEWALLPNCAFIGAILPSEIMSCPVQYMKFPEWLGKNSSNRKKVREIRELAAATSPVTFGSSRDMLFYYARSLLDLIQHQFTLPMDEKSKVNNIVDILEYHGLTLDVLKEVLPDVQYPSIKDALIGVSTQTKTLLTKTYNEKHKQSIKATKSKKRIGGDAPSFKKFNEDAEEEAERLSDNEEDEESNEEEEQIVEVKPNKVKVNTSQKSKSKGSQKSAKKTK